MNGASHRGCPHPYQRTEDKLRSVSVDSNSGAFELSALIDHPVVPLICLCRLLHNRATNKHSRRGRTGRRSVVQRWDGRQCRVNLVRNVCRVQSPEGVSSKRPKSKTSPNIDSSIDLRAFGEKYGFEWLLTRRLLSIRRGRESNY